MHSIARCLAIVTLFAASTLVAAQEDAVDLTIGESELRKHLSTDEFTITTLRLWPEGAPDESRKIGDETFTGGRRGSRITNVTKPSITVARPKNLTAATPAVLVCPGGGYGSLGVTDGGVEIIQWLKERGITGVYMKYRVPSRGSAFPKRHQPLQDIQRATSMLRSRADELGIDPKRIGAIGFSAGGNLTALLSTNHLPEYRRYEPIDDFDKTSCRPDFVAMVAPAYLTDPILSDQLADDLNLDAVRRNITPPTFITSAVTDKFTVGASHYMLALREKHVPVEMHIYEKGGHAEGIHDGPDNQWPVMFEDWLRRIGVIVEGDGR